MEKHQASFYTWFKNLPYTDEEWERANSYSREFGFTENTTRPVHGLKHGPAARTHEEARAVCEKAVAQGAQMVGYVMYAGRMGGRENRESWALRSRHGKWYKLGPR